MLENKVKIKTVMNKNENGKSIDLNIRLKIELE